MGWVVGVLGGLAGVTASVLTHPLDSLKVRMYLYGEGLPNATPRLSIARQIYQAEGSRAFLSGMTATCVRQSLFSSVRFAAHDHLERLFQRRNGSGPAAATSIPQKLVAGALAGALAAAVACPADVVLVRMQADGRLPPPLRRNYRHVLHGAAAICRSAEGPRALFRGLGPLLTRACGLTAIQFTTYEVAKARLVQGLGMDAGSVATHLGASFVAGFLATVVCNPIDVVKARLMQAQRGVYTGTLNCVLTTFRTEGPRGLYKGLAANLLRQCPQVMLMWVFFEQYTQAYRAGVRWYYALQGGTPHGPAA